MLWNEPANKVLFFYKPPGITSAECLNKVREEITEIFGFRLKAGHTGTIDRFAEGLLIILLGRSTAFSEVFLKQDKSYISEFRIGIKTDTFDPEGTVIEKWDEETTREFMKNHTEEIQRYIRNLTSLKEQIPPRYSAVKVQGKRASDWMRQGMEKPLPVKKIRIYQSQLLSYSEDGTLNVMFRVSSGTYIRAIARDLGEMLGAPVTVTKLQRTGIGKWNLENVRVSRFRDYHFYHILDVLPEDWGKVVVSAEKEIRVKHGGKIPVPATLPQNRDFLILNRENQILAWAKKQHATDYRYKKVFT